jgi:hypothetical protein
MNLRKYIKKFTTINDKTNKGGNTVFNADNDESNFHKAYMKAGKN